MIAVLDALAAWREAMVTGLSCSHPFTDNALTMALPTSRLTIKPAGTFTVPVCVALDLEERVTVEKETDLATVVGLLRDLSGGLCYTAGARIHSHVLISETPAPDENQRWQTVLRWKVVASWE